MKRGAACCAGLLAAAAAAAGPCGAELAAARRLQGERHELAYAVTPAPLATGRHFALDVVACPREGVAPPESLRVDARMPEHGHGMNYRPSVRRLGEGRWRVEGLLLHMAGRWQLSFELREGERVERLAEDLQLR